ncbi:MAG TPA: sigma-E factor regulatory protein RseB domain-containing protein [Egibacteraceae bacterium]|nr:sigma-E factor regulatory protein RseB domain-containing protein [Egibacteraceae bacterium]
MLEPGEAENWRDVLLRASEAAQRRRYTGEALSIAWSDGEPHVVLSDVHRDRDNLTVSFPDRFSVRLGAEDGDIVHEEEGWLAPLPAVNHDDAEKAVAALEEKYEVAVTGEDRLLDRPSTRLEVRQRADGSLRERLWVDEDTGLLLRRESFEGAGRRLRLIAYLSLDLRPGAAVRAGGRAARDGGTERLDRRSQAISPVDPDALSALRQAGWTVPATLPGSYEPVGMYAVDGSHSQPLQVVYGDGLYTVSIFQQRGRPDWDSLPEGAEPAKRLGWHAYEWPGAVPQRLVWEASGTTFSLVGDAPPEEFFAIAESLPNPQGGSLADRLRRGLSRLWDWVSQ